MSFILVDGATALSWKAKAPNVPERVVVAIASVTHPIWAIQIRILRGRVHKHVSLCEVP